MRRRSTLFRGLFSSRKKISLDFDEVLLDSTNLPNFDQYQLEGRVEKSLSKYTVYLLGGFFFVVGLIFLVRVGYLQIIDGEKFRNQSENNRLSSVLIFSERGIVHDRNGQELIWNIPGESQDVSSRAYIDKEGFGHVLGYLTYPKRDNSGVFFQTEYEGKAGIEKEYNDILNGESGIVIIETDALFNIQSQNVVKPPSDGQDLNLTIDVKVQEKLYSLIESLSDQKGFSGGAGVVMHVESGEILALTSYPEFSSAVLSDGDDGDIIQSYVTNTNMPFLNRAVSGLYTPGSIIKPIIAIAALQEGVVSEYTSILSTGSITLPNPYDSSLPGSVFTDWKAHGQVDIRKALAMSSNVYFYEVTGGYKDQKGIGIVNIEKYSRHFGIASETGIDLPGEAIGVIPNPEWKADNFGGEIWRIGDTYHTAIGQYGFQVTLVQMARAIAGIANFGSLPVPHVVQKATKIEETVGIDSYNYHIVQEGMRQAVTAGTAAGLHVSYVEVAAKTGTAEVGVVKKLVNSWIVGYYPYDNPQYVFVVVMEKGPRENMIGGLFVMRQLLDWMHTETPEYISF